MKYETCNYKMIKFRFVNKITFFLRLGNVPSQQNDAEVPFHLHFLHLDSALFFFSMPNNVFLIFIFLLFLFTNYTTILFQVQV